MDNGNVSALHLEDHDLAHSDWLLLVVGEEQQVSSVKRWLHAATEDYNDGAFTSSDHHESLPYHQRRRHNHAETEQLVQELSFVHAINLVNKACNHFE